MTLADFVQGTLLVGLITGGNVGDAQHYRFTGVMDNPPPCRAGASFTISGACSSGTPPSEVVISYSDSEGGTGSFTGSATCNFK
jgi:hypothetical protein